MAECEQSVTSEALAWIMGTNAVVIHRIVAAQLGSAMDETPAVSFSGTDAL